MWRPLKVSVYIDMVLSFYIFWPLWRKGSNSLFHWKQGIAQTSARRREGCQITRNLHEQTQTVCPFQFWMLYFQICPLSVYLGITTSGPRKASLNIDLVLLFLHCLSFEIGTVGFNIFWSSYRMKLLSRGHQHSGDASLSWCLRLLPCQMCWLVCGQRESW